MNSFINKLVERHHSPENNVKPRPQMRFENGFNDGFIIQDDIKESTAKQDSKITQNVQREIPKSKGKKDENNVKTNPIKTEKKVQTIINKNHSKEAISPKEIHPQNNFVKPDSNFVPERNTNQLIKTPPLKALPAKEINSDETGATNTFTTPSMVNNFTNSSTNNNNINQTDEISNRFFTTINPEEKQAESQVAVPTIKVNIGKIEVRANMPQKTPLKRTKKVIKPKLTLDNYLNKQQ